MADIFISYAREDRPWVEKLASQLQVEGFSVWWDRELLIGKRYREMIEAELQECKATVVVWSKHSIGSDFVRDEAEEAQQRNVMVPVLKDMVRPPAGFRQIQSADLSNWAGGGANAEFRRVLKGVAQLVGRPAVGDGGQIPAGPTVASTRPAALSPAAPRTFQIHFPPDLLARLPPSTHPVWRYAAIGAVALVALVYLTDRLIFSSPERSVNPATPGTSVAGGTNAAGSSNAGNTASLTGPRTDGGTDGDLGQGGNAGTPAGRDLSATLASPNGGATDTASLSSDIATVVAKAEAADRNARARAALALEQKNLADAAAGRARAGEGAAVGLLTGRDGAGNTFTYAGEVSDGTEQGVGDAAVSNGGLYSGQWLRGVAQGHGVYTYGNGDRISGEFDENVASGLGTGAFADKTKGLGYSGQWTANVYNGYGVFYLQDGSRLEGLWRLGQLNGLGAKFDRAGKLLEQGTYANSVLMH